MVNSMTIVNFYKSHIRAFYASSHRFRDIQISKIRDLENVGQDHDAVVLTQMHIRDFYLIALVMLAFSQCLLFKIATCKV